jgi:hypothetical protein
MEKNEERKKNKRYLINHTIICISEIEKERDREKRNHIERDR